MEIDIRSHIKNNFKDSTIEEIKDSIEESIEKKEEITLPGLGVLFEILWKNTKEKDSILNTIKENI